ncbi:dehydroshikimate dehydratase QsuB [Yaniella flava]|uniref:3-dehydroshikimate dehydratase n=1 Tax=Yaniella flava TaxID=287930 RepID=A0ABN2UT82_9MICC
MKTSIATVCLSGTLEEKMQACATAGFDGIEVFEADLVVSPSSPAEIKALADRLGLTLDLYQPFRDFEGVEEAQFQDNLRRLEAKFQLMQELGMDLVLVPSNAGTATVNDDAVVADQLRRAAELAQRYDVRIAYEALAWGRFVNTYWHSWELVEAADHPNLGVCLDSFHILSRDDDPARITDIPADKIFFVQLADAPDLGMDLLPWSRHHRVFPGEGSFDMVGFMAKLTETGYDGPLSLEIFNDVFRETDPVLTAADGLRSLRWIQQGARGRVTEAAAARVELATMPKIDPVETIDHVEISTDSPDECGALLGALGFRFAGQHRRKAPQLFVADGVKVVLSPTQSGGTSIASVAVQVADSAKAFARARALGAPLVSRPVTADEVRLPGVFSPGGTQLFFVDEQAASWPTEFGSDPDKLAQHSATMRLDHLNVPEAWDHFGASVLFTLAMLRMEPLEAQNVASPRGLVHSQVLESPQGGIRWNFNRVPRTYTDRAGQPVRYPGHIALAVDDLEQRAREATSAGLTVLPIPSNYYADLKARFGLDDATVTRWQELGILYDRNADGEFLHLYSETIGGLFFELVQRVGAYNDYGPGNAAVRLAAQQQHEQLTRAFGG